MILARASDDAGGAGVAGDAGVAGVAGGAGVAGDGGLMPKAQGPMTKEQNASETKVAVSGRGAEEGVGGLM